MSAGVVSGRRIGGAVAALLALAMAAWMAFAASSAVALTPKPPVKAAAKAKLVAFPSCERFVSYARREARKLVDPFGLAGYVQAVPAGARAAVPEATVGGAAAPAAPMPAAADSAAGGALQTSGPTFSGTNLQEAGVDEPDIVKTDGERIFAIANSKLFAVAPGAPPKLLGSLELKDVWPTEILLRGDRLLVIGSEAFAHPIEDGPGGPVRIAADAMIFPMPPAKTVLAEIDVSNPADMRVVTRLEVEGGYVAGRLTGSTVRLVTNSIPNAIPFTAPASDTPVAAARAESKNRRTINATDAGDFLPGLEVERDGKLVRRGNAVPCRAVTHTARFNGLGMVTVLTLDLNGGLRIVDRDAVMTDGNTVYASQKNLYIASPRWFAPNEDTSGIDASGSTTQIHRFDISQALETDYMGSGVVRGFPLNQFSFSEDKGNLRVATTDDPPWTEEGQQGQSESFVTVLTPTAKGLSRIGQVGGLGKGERIYAVRMIGDRGYVVTFRQVDPLYTLDLSDPTNPRTTGELKIPGFSSYLHPVGEHRLIGIGQSATDEGRATGSQVSLFDVSDPAAPKRLAQYTIGKGYSEAENDHHAVMFWAPTGLLAIPFQEYGEYPGPPPFTGAVGLRIGDDSIAPVGRVSHPAITEEEGGYSWYPSVRRALVIGDALYTLSDQGIGAADLATLADRGFVSLAK
jgi:uncharacterized secreted protein with C-terminal beta-propeller domain